MDEKEEKPLSVMVEELKEEIINIIGNSRLPLALVGEIFANLNSQIQSQIQKEINDYRR